VGHCVQLVTEISVAPHRVVCETLDTLYRLLLRSVEHRVELLVGRGTLFIACY